MNECFDVLVIGGGASGLMCALECAQFANVAVIEANERVGKKILASGNGRCNLSNLDLSYKNYNTNKVSNILEKYTPLYIRSKWKEYGLLTKVEDVRVYPYSESANSVLNVLLNKLNSSKINLKLSTKVEKIKKESDEYKVITNNGIFTCKYLVLACGSKATTGIESYNLVKALGHKVTKLTPSLVALKSKSIVGANGVRCKVECYVEIDNKSYPKEKGELLFKDGAISGVLAFRMSSYISRANKEGYKKAILHIDFAPDYKVDELAKFIKDSFNPRSNLLEGILHKAIALNVVANTKMDRSLLMSEVKALSLAKTIKDYICDIEGVMGFNNAQVVSGGIDLADINMDSLESNINKGMYILGEMLDVDGECGGYNLHWAWASALACSSNIKEVFNK